LNPSHLLFDDDHHLRLDLSSSLHFRNDRCFDRSSFCVRYQAPEIEGGGTVDSSTDVYSFGVLLYGLFTGKPIINPGLLIEDFHNNLKAEILPALPESLDVSIRDLILSCLSYDCSNRPPIEAVLFKLLKTGPDPFSPKCFADDQLADLWQLGLTLEERSRPDGFSGIVDLLRRQADSGDALAQNGDGCLGSSGWGWWRENKEVGVADFQKSGHSGNAAGWFHGGRCHQEGKGTAPDRLVSARDCKRSADLGHPPGIYADAVYFSMGLGVPQDLVSAARYYKTSVIRLRCSSMGFVSDMAGVFGRILLRRLVISKCQLISGIRVRCLPTGLIWRPARVLSGTWFRRLFISNCQLISGIRLGCCSMGFAS
jgi:hypothetical protein